MEIMKRLFALLIINSISNISLANVDCDFSSGYKYNEYTMPMAKSTITVGRDTPLGSEIYDQTFHHTVQYFTCTGTGTVYNLRAYGHTPLPLANWSQGPYANKVYETGIPGIGILFYQTSAYPNSEPYEVVNSGTTGLGSSTRVNVKLIKIGPISPGIIRAADLPSATYKSQDSNSTIDRYKVYLANDITVVSQTCEIPDVTVDLGENSIEPLVSGAQNDVGRKDFVVVMRNCPTFYGKLSSALWHGPNGSLVSFNERRNDIKISFRPTNGVLDSEGNIAKLDPIQPNNSTAAQGIGIALYDPSGTRYKFDGHFVNVATPEIGSSADITIPLQAAYTFDTAKPKSDIKPGSGNAAIEFTIQYN